MSTMDSPESAVFFFLEEVLDELAVNELEASPSGSFQTQRAKTVDVSKEAIR
jgi:hypothetical protein